MWRERGKLRRPLLIIAVVVVAFVLITLMVENTYYQLMLTLVTIWATMGISWNVLSGYSGMISFGHASFFGLGAYTVTLMLVELDITPWIGLPFGILAGMIAAVIIGFPTFRLRGHYFALAMLAYPLALLYIFEWLGYQEVPLPMKREEGALYAQFEDQRVYAMLGMVLVILALAISLWIERSRFGLSLLAIKQNEPAAAAAGINVLMWKMRAIVVSGGIAAAAGSLYAVVLLVVTPPTVFGVLTSAQALIVTLFGGVGTLWGPLIGAGVLIPLAEALNAELGHIIPGINGVVFGLAIVFVIVLAPEGVFWAARDWLAKRRGAAAGAPGAPEEAGPGGAGACAPDAGGEPLRPMSISAASSSSDPAPDAPAPARPSADGRTLLEIDGIVKQFGGLRALDSVTLDVPEGAIQGIIGPNGAGKTTLFNVLNGFMRPNEGDVRFVGDSLTKHKPHKICALGIGRTFQVVRSFARMSILENVVVGAFVGTKDDDEAEAMAIEALEKVGLSRHRDSVASGLTTHQLRLMELARALAPRPRLLLLDETLAGLGSQEIEDMLRVVQRVRDDGTTIVIIEHTMHAMVRLADRFAVLDHGSVIATGDPQQVVKDPKVIEAYLGKKWMERAAH